MRLRGGFRGPETVLTAGPVTVTFDSEVDAARLRGIVTHGAGECVLELAISVDDVFGGLAGWLALRDPGYCTLDAVWRKDDAPPVPVATTFPSGEAMVGWSPASFDGRSLAVPGRGPRGLAVSVMQWDAAGRPGSQSLALQVHLASEPNPNSEGLLKIEKRWTTILVEWPGG
ncbi:MAG: hypothetical protein ACRD0U_05420 [Acidimicrobiales bacterium]